MEHIGTVEREIIATKQKLAIAALAEGMTITAAAQVAGVGRTTLHRWLREPLFRAELDEATIEADERAIERIRLMNERHAKLAVLAQDKIVERLKTFDPEELSPLALIRWLWVAVKVERVARGLDDRASSITVQPASGYDASRGGPIPVAVFDGYAEFGLDEEDGDPIPCDPVAEDESDEQEQFWLQDDVDE